MVSWWQRARVWWTKIFFWHHAKEGSQEFQPETHDDHALVLTVTKTQPLPRWQQLRFLNRLFKPRERRLFWGGLIIGMLLLASGIFDLLRPHLVQVPSNGGSVVEAIVGSPRLINPLLAGSNDVDHDLSSLVYSGLFRLDENLQPQPDLVQQYRWLDAGRTLEVTLRSDVRFHDGEPLTSEDVVFTYQAIHFANWHSPLARDFVGVKAIQIDDHTVQFQLDKPNPNLLANLTLGILPGHIWEPVADNNAQLAEANLKPIGSGPYQVVSFTPDAKGGILSYHLQRFEQYYGLKPHIQDWEFRFYADRQESQQALRGNQADLLAFLPWGDVDQLQNKNVRSIKLELPQETVAFFNLQDPLLKDERIRQALAMAVDRQELQTLLGARIQVINGPFPLNPTTSTPADLDAARTLLTNIGWALKDGDSVRQFVPPAVAPAPSQRRNRRHQTTPAIVPTAQASSTPLAISIEAPDQPDLLKVAEYLKRRWSLLGIKVTVRSQDSASLLHQVLMNRQHQVLIWNVLLPPDENLSPFWHSGNAAGNGLNLSGLRDQHVDQALDAVTAATTTQAVLAARDLVSQAILAHAPALFLARADYAELISNRIRGATDMRIGRPSDRLLQANKWYLTTSWRWK